MSLTFLFLLLIAVGVGLSILTKKLNLLKYSPPDNYGNRDLQGVNWKPVTFVGIAIARAISLKQQEITSTYVEYQRVLKWDGVMPTTTLGSGSNTLFNLK